MKFRFSPGTYSLAIGGLLVGSLVAAEPVVIEVSPNAKNGASSLAEGLNKLREACAAHPAKPKRLLLHPGIYEVSETLKWDETISGTPEGPVEVVGAGDGKAVLRGATPVQGWKDRGDGLWETTIPQNFPYPKQLFADDERLPIARAPKSGYFYAAKPFVARNLDESDSAKQAFYAEPKDLKDFGSDPNAYILLVNSWTSSRHLIDSFDPQTGLVRLASLARWPMGYWEYRFPYWVEGAINAVSSPGEWAFEQKSRKLVYCPRPGEALETFAPRAPRVMTILALEGKPGKPVRHVTFRNITFEESNWELARDNSADGQNCRFMKSYGIFGSQLEHVNFLGCTFQRLGGYAIWFEKAVVDGRINDNHFTENASGAIHIGMSEMPEEKEKYFDGQKRWDHSPEAACRRMEITGNRILNNGRVFPSTAAIWMTSLSDSSVTHNEVGYQPHVGISVGWSWVLDDETVYHAERNTIAYNYIHHIGDGRLSDLAGVYTLTNSPGTKVTGNVVQHVTGRLYGGFGLYADASSMNIEFSENFVMNTTSSSFFRHYGKMLAVKSNVFAESKSDGMIGMGLTQAGLDADWMTVTRNIFYNTENRQMLMPRRYKTGRYLFKNNVFWSTIGEPDFEGKSLAEWEKDDRATGNVVENPFPEGLTPATLKTSPAIAKGYGSLAFLKAGLPGQPFGEMTSWESAPKNLVTPRIPVTSVDATFDELKSAELPYGAAVSNGKPRDVWVKPHPGGQGNILVIANREKSSDQPPTLSFEPMIQLDNLTMSVDIRISGGATFRCQWNESRHLVQAVLLDLTVSGKDGLVTANGEKVGTIEPGKWHRFSIEPASPTTQLLRVSDVGTGQVKAKLTLNSEDGPKLVRRIKFWSSGSGDGALEMDNLKIAGKNPAQPSAE